MAYIIYHSCIRYKLPSHLLRELQPPVQICKMLDLVRQKALKDLQSKHLESRKWIDIFFLR